MPPDPPGGGMPSTSTVSFKFPPPQCGCGTLKCVKNTSRMSQIHFQSIHVFKFHGWSMPPQTPSGGMLTHTLYINNFIDVPPKHKILYKTLHINIVRVFLHCIMIFRVTF